LAVIRNGQSCWVAGFRHYDVAAAPPSYLETCSFKCGHGLST